ncbi:unnamed protein product [Owenia fusiformis]|uniref:Carbohydrate sulfotransferase n=1 Tax=Owenia fusiformis TaxID=6347 RepID=A0A8J1UYB7_OWEFU|nr:unnamed protein product [Owenia fusiformis]
MVQIKTYTVAERRQTNRLKVQLLRKTVRLLGILLKKMAILGKTCMVFLLGMILICAVMYYISSEYHITKKYSLLEQAKENTNSKDDGVDGIEKGVVGNQKLNETFNDRKKLLETVCDEIYNGHRPSIKSLKFPNIIVNDKLKILYCKVPKVACSNWLRLLYIADAKLSNITPSDKIIETIHIIEEGLRTKYFPTLDMYSNQDKQYRIRNYLKFTFVRDPFERIFSAYLNKFVKTPDMHFRKDFGVEMYRLINEDVPPDDFKTGDNITFRQFIKTLVHPRIGRPFNEHWQQYAELCHPCSIKYDIIGKYETMDTDVLYTLNKMGLDGNMSSFLGQRYKHSNTKELLPKAYKTVPKDDLNKLKALYGADFRLFGYNSSSL